LVYLAVQVRQNSVIAIAESERDLNTERKKCGPHQPVKRHRLPTTGHLQVSRIVVDPRQVPSASV
jgi:hypothetical protein